MDRNLGALENSRTANHREYGLYYQAGKKDPICYATQYNINGVKIRNLPQVVGVSLLTDICYTIKHPDFHIRDNSLHWMINIVDYTKSHSLALWLNPQWHQNNSVDKSVTKSLFDPCPSGWYLPKKEVYDNVIKLSSREKWDEGYLFSLSALPGTSDAAYFPAAGYLDTGGHGLWRAKLYTMIGTCETSTSWGYVYIIHEGVILSQYSGEQHFNSACGGNSLRCIQE